MDAPDRSKRVLAALVREYIVSGEPVASSVLVSAAGLGVSSATVRSILAHLEEEGFLQQPHTSAGRIPTDRGYRYYVDLLLENKRPHRSASFVEARLRREGSGASLEGLLPQATHVLSKCGVGFAVRPAHETAVFDRVEFVPLSSSRVLVIIVARGGHVLQKAVETDESLTADDLRQAANYLNAEFAGLPLNRARELVLERIKEERLLYDVLMARAMRLATFFFAELPDEASIHIEGAAALFEQAQGLTLQTLQALVQMIEEKRRLVRLLDDCIDGPGLTIVIGAEHPDPSLRSFSLIASTFEDGDGIGTVGVIGPTRMRYPRTIAVVDATAEAMSRVLRHPN
ncbi:MAG TPA: heat-inducible transcriptional repressor HrcA [Vicinamibacterales bacterium]|jgi:heat-inducible transcriptional repressor|nr:heat-inducible transcriptional repressor HrcA [Vicinamibacterales bacterium]